MDLYKKAITDLFARLTPADLADEIGCSVATVKQAALSEGSNGKRTPPPGWEAAARRLAERQATHFAKLAKKLTSSG